MLPIHTILHPTDFSPQSEYALQVARSLARDYGAKLVVLHVIPSPTFVEYASIEEALHGKPEGEEHHLHSKLRQMSLNYHLVQGDPTEHILKVALQIQADLIVMGTHGRTGLSRTLVGSVAESVLRRASCPVLTLKRPLGESEKRAEAGATSTAP